MIKLSMHNTKKEIKMKKRKPLAVFFLPVITFGIYYFVWFVKVKEELKSQGASIPTAWFLIIPFANIYLCGNSVRV